jgi:hypothetical protein
VLLVEHRLLELRRTGQHAVLVDRRFRRGQDVQIAVIEDSAPETLAQDGVVDLFERAVSRALVDHAADLHQAAVGDEVFLGPPQQVLPEDDDQATAKHDDGYQSIHVGNAAREVEDRDDRQQDDRKEPQQPAADRVAYERHPVLAPAQDDALAIGQQFVGVGHRVPPPSGTGVSPRVNLLDPLPGQVRVQLCGGDAGVAEQFLHDAQVRSAFQQVCRKRMAQRMRRDVAADAASAPLGVARARRTCATTASPAPTGTTVRRAVPRADRAPPPARAMVAAPFPGSARAPRWRRRRPAACAHDHPCR